MSREEISKQRAAQILGANPDVFESPLTVLASPAWRGIEGDIWKATANGKSAILKHYHADTAFYVDSGKAILAAQEAGKLNVGPTVIEAWAEDKLLAFEELGSPWRSGGLHDIVTRDVRAKIIDLKKSYQLGAKLNHSVSIFDEINAFFEITKTNGITTHNDIEIFMGFFRDAEAKINSLGKDKAPCHRDGNTANIMINSNGEIKLIDFDLAANCDPFEDIGCHLVECFESDAEARLGFEEWHGSFDEGLFQRSMLYGMADDMRWGLIGSIMADQSERRVLEFSKYAAWRFIRLQINAKHSDANNRIRFAT